MSVITPRALDKGIYSGAKVLVFLDGYLAVWVWLSDAPENSAFAMVLGGGLVVTMLTSEALVVVVPLRPAFVLRLKVLRGCSRSLSIKPYFKVSSICTPISCRSEKVGKGSTIIFCINFG